MVLKENIPNQQTFCLTIRLHMTHKSCKAKSIRVKKLVSYYFEFKKKTTK